MDINQLSFQTIIVVNKNESFRLIFSHSPIKILHHTFSKNEMNTITFKLRINILIRICKKTCRKDLLNILSKTTYRFIQQYFTGIIKLYTFYFVEKTLHKLDLIIFTNASRLGA